MLARLTHWVGRYFIWLISMAMVVCGVSAVALGLLYGAIQTLGLNTLWLPVVCIAIGMAATWLIVLGLSKIDHIFR